jgi:branched-chain amino acid aminotransferase
MTAFEKMDGKIWYNGEVIDWRDAKIHTLTHGLHYGSSVFEGIRIYNSRPFKVREHLDRLHHSAECLGFTIPFSTDQLVEATHTQIEMNKINDGYARPFAWRGTESMLIAGGSKVANTAIAVWPTFESDRKALRERGSRLCISTWRKPAANASPYSAKAASIYTLCTIVKNQATELGYDDALMLDGSGNITEGTTSNFFLIKGR